MCRVLYYFENLLIFVSAASGCVLIFAFGLLVGVPLDIANSGEGLKTCVLIVRSKKSIIKKKSKKHDNILNTIEVLVSQALINSYINHDKFISMNHVLREYNEIKERIKSPEYAVEYTI